MADQSIYRPIKPDPFALQKTIQPYLGLQASFEPYRRMVASMALPFIAEIQASCDALWRLSQFPQQKDTHR